MIYNNHFYVRFIPFIKLIKNKNQIKSNRKKKQIYKFDNSRGLPFIFRDFAILVLQSAN